MAKKLMKGAEAIGEAAIRAGCRAYFCYPITPQTEVAEYLSKRMPEAGGVFLQAESELAASYMIFGAAGAGAKVFTTSSSPGISLMSEAISYIAAAELPAVFVNIMRSGPGLGGILPSQGDYFQATKGGGHGDYRMIVLAPATVQESVELVMDAFNLADKYRNPVMVIGDGLIGQMMEPVEFPENYEPSTLDYEQFATTGKKSRERNLIRTLYLDSDELEWHNQQLLAKFRKMEEQEVRFEEYGIDDDTEYLLVSYGTSSRVCKTMVDDLQAEGVKIGLLRPITVHPFPIDRIRELSKRPALKRILCVEMSLGQMIEDVERANQGRQPVTHYGKTGGVVPDATEVIEHFKSLI